MPHLITCRVLAIIPFLAGRVLTKDLVTLRQLHAGAAGNLISNSLPYFYLGHLAVSQVLLGQSRQL